MEIAPVVAVAVLITLGLMISAYKFGVLNQLTGGISGAAGILAGLFCYAKLPEIVQSLVGITLPNKLVVVAAIIAFIIVMGTLRFLIGWILKVSFNADSPLHNLSDGPIGALIALIPAGILLCVLAIGVRMGGTLMELRQLQNITRTGVQWGTHNYPKWPISTTWRDGIEAIPFAMPALDLVDPVSRKSGRNLAGLLIASKNERLRAEIESTEQAGGILKSEAFAGLEQNEVVQLLNESNKRPALLMNPDVQKASRNSDIYASLNILDIKALIDAFQKNDGTREATAPTIGEKQISPPPKGENPFRN